MLAFCSCATVRSRYHTVSAGETMALIAKTYAVPLEALVGSNDNVPVRHMEPGTRLFIPFESRPDWNDADVRLVRQSPTSREVADAGPSSYRWPVVGTISSYFGRRGNRPHEGIDIAADRGTPILSARAGHVIYSGNGIRGYGNLVIVRHADNFTTVYAHLNKIQVRRGQYVRGGQRVGTCGRTGRASGYHLHFEIRNNRVPVNPLLYLRRQYAANKVAR